MDYLVAGGAGFIGRWIVRDLLKADHRVCVVDSLARGKKENLAEFMDNKNFTFVLGDIKDKGILRELFANKFDACVHMASVCDVQLSIDNPEESFETDICGTFNLLEEARKKKTKFVFVSTGLVYEASNNPINEDWRTKPSSPYTAAKLAAEHLVMSYYYAYGLPVVVLRPFNIYGPFGLFKEERGEGGVILKFIKRSMRGEELQIFGSGEQTRDFLYVEDCADFIIRASTSKNAIGEIINAGYGKDVSINELAVMIADGSKIVHIEHHHPQSEVDKLICNYDKANRLLGWSPKTTLEEGIEKTKTWLMEGEL